MVKKDENIEEVVETTPVTEETTPVAEDAVSASEESAPAEKETKKPAAKKSAGKKDT